MLESACLRFVFHWDLHASSLLQGVNSFVIYNHVVGFIDISKSITEIGTIKRRINIRRINVKS